MNVLIVDDEISSIRAVSNMLDWSSVGVDQVYTALSAQEARDVIARNHVDVLLCDIEMPQESGLDLLEWINQEKLGITCIYMTCYAEFGYAQRAVKLGSSAYLLKPIDPDELEREITAAIARRREFSQMRSARQILEENEEKTCQQFWRDLFYEEIPSEAQAVSEQIRRLQLPLDPGWAYCPVLLAVRSWGKNWEEDETNTSGRYAVHNVAQDLLDKATERDALWHTVFQFGKNAQLALCGGTDGNAARACCETFARKYLEAEETYLAIQTVCYVGKALPITEVAQEIETLLRLDSNHLQNHGLVFHAEETSSARGEGDLNARFDRWAALLEGEQFDIARREIVGYLTSQVENRWFNRRRFIYFRNNYAGMLVSYSERHHFPLNQLTAQPENAACFERSENSLEDMRAWVECSLGQLASSSARISQDPVTATKVFIEDHLSDDLDVILIADNVHLNQDYLTRIFKRETGLTVKSYVVARRMERARELLETSKLPIADVAYQVGYYNYASFNRIFKKTYGRSPQSFRKPDP